MELRFDNRIWTFLYFIYFQIFELLLLLLFSFKRFTIHILQQKIIILYVYALTWWTLNVSFQRNDIFNIKRKNLYHSFTDYPGPFQDRVVLPKMGDSWADLSSRCSKLGEKTRKPLPFIIFYRFLQASWWYKIYLPYIFGLQISRGFFIGKL